jgi:hypothetical protein
MVCVTGACAVRPRVRDRNKGDMAVGPCLRTRDLLDIDSTSFRQRPDSARDGDKRRARSSDAFCARQFTLCDAPDLRTYRRTQSPDIGSNSPETRIPLRCAEKKPCSAWNRVDRMEQSRRRVDACRPITTKPAKLLLTSNCTCYCLELLLHLQFLPIYSKLQTADSHQYFNCHCMRAGPRYLLLLAATPCCFALILRASIASTAERRTASYSLRTALLSTVRFKHDARGRSHRWSSVIRRSMENSVGEHPRMQLRETRGFGGLIWRIDVTARAKPRTAKSAAFTPSIEQRRAQCHAVNRAWRNRRS